MFKEQSLFVIVENNDIGLQIFRVEMEKEVQKEICNFLSFGASELNEDKEYIKFNGSYKPETNEILIIKGFSFDLRIIEAIKNPIGVAAFIPNKSNPPKIKAVFIGKYSVKNSEEQYTIAFQRFRKDQYIAKVGINIFHDANTFVQEKRFGICITDTVDCIIVNDELRFTSFYYARQIFDLSNYYREATDTDIENFINNKKINVENASVFKDNADSMVRRKIALISDSGIFLKYTVKQIKERAKGFGLHISTVKDKLSLPNDKRELKTILKFLDDEIYRGIFSEEILQTNSKRRAEI